MGKLISLHMGNRICFIGIILSCFLSLEVSGQNLKIPQFDFETELQYDKDSVDIINAFFEDVVFVSIAKIKPSYENTNSTGQNYSHHESVLNFSNKGDFIGIDTSTLEFKITLRGSDIHTLLSLIFDYNHFGDSYTYDCYEPRHIILFQNEERIIVGAVEICFECNGIRSGGIYNGFSKSNINRFKDFFIKMGLIED